MTRCLVALAAVLALSAQGALAASAHGPRTDRRPVVITTDAGSDMDDAWVVAHAALQPSLDLRGVVGCHVPNVPSPEQTAANARDALAHLPLATRPPCYAGSPKALDDVHTPLPNAGVRFLIAEAHRCSPKMPLTVYVLGSGTDVASAVLLDPSIVPNLQVIGMAFDSYDTGKDGWNVSNDVKSWEVLLAAHLPIVIGDGPTTQRDLMLSRSQSRALFGALGAPGKYLADLHANYVDANRQMVMEDNHSPDLWPIWDEVANAYMLGYTRQETRPRPVLHDDCTFTHPAGGFEGMSIAWITHIDGAATFKDFQTCLGDALGTRR